MSSDRCGSTKSIETLIENISVFYVSADVCSRCSFINTLRVTLPWMSLSSLGQMIGINIWSRIVNSRIYVVRGISNLALVEHCIWVTWIYMWAIINVEIQLLLVTIISIVPHKRHNILSWWCSLSIPGLHCLIWKIKRCHLILIRRRITRAHFHYLIESIE